MSQSVPWVLTGTHQRDRMMESSERQPFVVGVVMVVMSSVSRYTRYLSTHLLGRERASRCSVDLRGSCTRVLVVVVATNSSASVACPHRLVHLLSATFDSSATVCTSSCASSRCLNTCSPFGHLKPTSLANLFASSKTCSW